MTQQKPNWLSSELRVISSDILNTKASEVSLLI